MMQTHLEQVFSVHSKENPMKENLRENDFTGVFGGLKLYVCF